MKANGIIGAAVAGGMLWLAALLGFGAMFDGYSHARHPVALPGAAGIDHALAFNVLGFLLPGLLVAWAALRLRAMLDHAGWPARIGAHLWLLSALAFAAQGVLPLDPEEMDAGSSRLHAVAWSLWWIAFLPGAVMLALRSRTFAVALGIAAAVLPVAALLMPVGLSQRVAIAAWFVLVGVAGHALARSEERTSGAGPQESRR